MHQMKKKGYSGLSKDFFRERNTKELLDSREIFTEIGEEARSAKERKINYQKKKEYE